MNLQHLRYFVAVAHAKSYAVASAHLHTTQPNITYAIAQIEEELGVKLFIKDGRNNQLTAYGKQFLSYAEGTLRTLDSGIHAIRRSVEEHTVIRLGFLRYLGIEYIPKLVSEFRKAHPEYKVEFEFETGSTASLFEGQMANRLDIVFCAPSRPVGGFKALISRQRFKVIAPKDHPLCGIQHLTLEDTLKYPYVYYVEGSSMRHMIDPYFKEIGTFPKTNLEVLESEVVAGFVAAGFGIGIVPDMYLPASLPIAELDITNYSLGRDIYMVLTQADDVSPILRKFYNYAVLHPDPKLLMENT